jgi:hypothetical protein
MRLLVDVPQVFFVLLAAFPLVRSPDGAGAPNTACGRSSRSPVLGTALRFTVGLFFPVVALFCPDR